MCAVGSSLHAGQLPHPGLQGEPDGLRVPVPRIQGHFNFAQKQVATQAFAVPHGQAQHAARELGLRDGVLGGGQEVRFNGAPLVAPASVPRGG